MSDLITHLEELSLNAWAPLQSMNYDGWVIRVANGYTKRANAIHPLYPSKKSLDEKIAFCEKLYRVRGLPTTFKLTSASQPHGLDAILVERSYEPDPEVSVQTFALAEVNDVISADVVIQSAPSEAWQAAFQRMQNLSAAQVVSLAQMLANILPERAFASIKVGEEIIACGLGVDQSGYVGLFDIVTDAKFRKRGYGRLIVENLLAWGKGQGATTAYLQVMLDNAPALHLYEKIGFEERYRYWYRIKA